MPLQKQNAKVYLLAGPTGSGKSELIRHFLENNIQALDLEEMCRHDGSVFSSLTYQKQPSSYQFHKQLLKTWNRFDLSKPIFIESELKRIGNLNLPEWLVKSMEEARLILLDVDKTLRSKRLSKIVEQADPGQFTACLQRLSFKLGPKKLGEAMLHFSLADWKATADILMDYYDSTPGYLFYPERIKIQITVNQWDAAYITRLIWEKLELSSPDGLSNQFVPNQP